MSPGIPVGRMLAICYFVFTASLPFTSQLLDLDAWAETWLIPGAMGFTLIAVGGSRWFPLFLAVEVLRAAVPPLVTDGAILLPTLIRAVVTVASYSAGAVFLRRVAGGTPRYDSPSTLNWFLLVVLIAPVTPAAASILAEGIETNDLGALLENLQFHWFAGATGLLAVAPAVIAVIQPLIEGTRTELLERTQLKGVQVVLPLWLELSIQALALGAALVVVFSIDEVAEGSKLFLLIPPLIWIAFSYGLGLASLGITLTFCAASLALEADRVQPDDLSIFALALLVTAASTLYFGALVTLQRRAERARLDQEESFRHLAEAAIQDNTRRRSSEEALRESEARYRALTEQAPDGVLVMDVQGGIVSGNPQMREVLGYDEDELRTKSLGDLIPPEESQDLQSQIAILRSGRPLTIVRRLMKKNTSRIYVEISARKIGEDRIQAILRDITERKLIEEALRESEGRYRDLFRHMLSGFALHEIVLDDSGHPVDYIFHEINPAFEEMTGLKRPRIQGKRVTEVLPGIDDGTVGWIETYARVALTGESVRFEQHSKELDRWYLVYAYSPQKRYFVTLFHDITEEKRAEEERRQLEERIQHGQKMESLGVLAGGVAHDFNNLLVGVLANAGLAKKRLGPGSRAVGPLIQIERSAQRAADLTSQMLAYSGKGQFQITSVDLSTLVREISELLQTVLSSKAQLVMDLPDDLPPVRVDVTQIRQVVMNLLTNASDALEGETGKIHLRTGVLDADEEYLAGTWPGDDLPPGNYIWVEVQDTGTGMDEETRRRMFDPFFTTRFTGRGLGLAAVLGIVRGHSGTLHVDSTPGAGTTFRVLLPKGIDELSPSQSERVLSPSVATGGTVLAVDDDDTVRMALREILDLEGYRVLEAVDGVDALAVYDSHADEIDAVVLDLTMPRMDGVAAFEALRERRGDLPILLSSGFGESAVDRLPSRARASYLRKPYTPAELLEAVAGLLEDVPDQAER